MNTAMYEHPLTSSQLDMVTSFWKNPNQCIVVPPIVKLLACGDMGTGALAAVDAIVATARQQLEICNVIIVVD